MWVQQVDTGLEGLQVTWVWQVQRIDMGLVGLRVT